MGSRNADYSGGLERSKAEKVIDPRENLFLEADSHELELDSESHSMRLVFLRGKEKTVLAHMILGSEDAYDFASRILHGYDKLEGLSK